jgi:NadR type nicotinamide-nucleotide adenylyltransferase
MRRIVVTGSESTGKTTLARALGERLATVATPEFSREYADARGVPLDQHDVEAIAMGQIALEDRRGLEARHGLMVLDTDLFSTVVYGPHYYGTLQPWIERAALERRGDLYLLLDIDVPWVPDAIRDRGQHRAHMHSLFRGMLERYGLPFVTIGGRWGERYERAVVEVERLLGAGSDAPSLIMGDSNGNTTGTDLTDDSD